MQESNCNVRFVVLTTFPWTKSPPFSVFNPLNKEAAKFFRTLSSYNFTTLRHNPEEHDLNNLQVWTCVTKSVSACGFVS
jgi:hypothetical protein